MVDTAISGLPAWLGQESREGRPLTAGCQAVLSPRARPTLSSAGSCSHGDARVGTSGSGVVPLTALHGTPAPPGPCTGEKDRRWGPVFPAQKRKAPSGLPQEHHLCCSLGESHWATFPSLGQEESRAQGPRWRPEQARCVCTAVPTPRHGRCPSQPLEHC